MSNYAPGWYPDASGRFAQRYYDGNAWTEHVVDASGNRSTDPVAAAGAPEAGGSPPASGPPAPSASGFAAPSGLQPSQPPSPPPAGFQPPDSSGGFPLPAQAGGDPSTPGAPSPGRFLLTIGHIVVAAGALFALLGITALSYWKVSFGDESEGINLADIADAGDGINALASSYASFGRWLGLLVIILAVVAVLKLKALAPFNDKLPLIAAIAAGVWGLWHLIGLFVAPDPATLAVSGLVGVLGYAGLAAGQFLPQPLTQ